MKTITTTSTSELIRMKMRGESLEPLVRSANETDPGEYMPAMAQASYDPQRTYLSTGESTSFDPSKFNMKLGFGGKPTGVLYGSEFWPKGKDIEVYDWMNDETSNEKVHSDWDLWTAQNMREWHSPKGMTYTYKPEARVYKVRSDKDLLKLPDSYWEPDISDEYWRRLGSIKRIPEAESKKLQESIYNDIASGKLRKEDFPHILNYFKLAKDWDAIDFMDSFAHQSTSDRRIKGSNRMVPVLDAGQSILLNKDMIADVRPWQRSL